MMDPPHSLPAADGMPSPWASFSTEVVEPTKRLLERLPALAARQAFTWVSRMV